MESNLLLKNWNLPDCVLEQYNKNGLESMFQWQAECLSIDGVLDGRNLVYAAPTSAGKTLVSEILLLKRILETGKKALFILPFISVAREKLFHMRSLFEEAGIRVDGYMGGHAPTNGFSSVDIAVCTIEKANGLINRLIEEKNIEQIGMLIVDELHMVGDEGRGYILELLLTKIRYMSEVSLSQSQSKIQIVGMSATLPNLKLLANWLDAALYTTEFRPVPLQRCLKVGSCIFDEQLRKIRDFSPAFKCKNDEESLPALCYETLEEGNSVLVFCPTKNWCEKLADSIARQFYELNNAHQSDNNLPHIDLNLENLKDIFEQLSRSPVGVDGILNRTLPLGVAYHHAGLTTEERDIVEAGFRIGAIRVLVATSTLSSGVNLPARRVIIRTPMFNRKTIDVRTYLQMTGRAGRKGVDDRGESILLCRPTEQSSGKSLLTAKPLPVKSCLIQAGNEELTTSMKRAILEIIVNGIASTYESVMKYTDCTLLSSQIRNETSKVVQGPITRRRSSSLSPIAKGKNAGFSQDVIENCIKWLVDHEFVHLQEKIENPSSIGKSERNIVATQLGRAALLSSLPTADALTVLADLHQAMKSLALDTELHLIYLVTPIFCYNDWTGLDWYQYLNAYESLSNSHKNAATLVGVTEQFLMRMASGAAIPKKGKQAEKMGRMLGTHRRFYAALALHDLVQEVPLSTVCSKYSCNRGMLQQLQQSAASFAGMVTTFCQELGWWSLEVLLKEFQTRLAFGVQRELIDLMQIPLLNSQRARALHTAGLSTCTHVSKSDPSHIELILRNSAHFQTARKGINEADWEVEERRKQRTIHVTGQRGLTEYDAAVLIIEEARRICGLQEELNKSNATIEPPDKLKDETTPIFNRSRITEQTESIENILDFKNGVSITPSVGNANNEATAPVPQTVFEIPDSEDDLYNDEPVNEKVIMRSPKDSGCESRESSLTETQMKLVLEDEDFMSEELFIDTAANSSSGCNNTVDSMVRSVELCVQSELKNTVSERPDSEHENSITQSEKSLTNVVHRNLFTEKDDDSDNADSVISKHHPNYSLKQLTSKSHSSDMKGFETFKDESLEDFFTMEDTQDRPVSSKVSSEELDADLESETGPVTLHLSPTNSENSGSFKSSPSETKSPITLIFDGESSDESDAGVLELSSFTFDELDERKNLSQDVGSSKGQRICDKVASGDQDDSADMGTAKNITEDLNNKIIDTSSCDRNSRTNISQHDTVAKSSLTDSQLCLVLDSSFTQESSFELKKKPVPPLLNKVNQSKPTCSETPIVVSGAISPGMLEAMDASFSICNSANNSLNMEPSDKKSRATNEKVMVSTPKNYCGKLDNIKNSSNSMLNPFVMIEKCTRSIDRNSMQKSTLKNSAIYKETSMCNKMLSPYVSLGQRVMLDTSESNSGQKVEKREEIFSDNSLEDLFELSTQPASRKSEDVATLSPAQNVLNKVLEFCGKSEASLEIVSLTPSLSESNTQSSRKRRSADIMGSPTQEKSPKFGTPQKSLGGGSGKAIKNSETGTNFDDKAPTDISNLPVRINDVITSSQAAVAPTPETSMRVTSLQSGLTIIDVCFHKELFTTFMHEWSSKKFFAIAVATGNTTPKKTKSKIGPSSLHMECEVSPDNMDEYQISGIAVCWGQQDAYYISLEDEGNTADEELYCQNSAYSELIAPCNVQDLGVKTRVTALAHSTCALKKKNCVLVAVDIKKQFKILRKIVEPTNAFWQDPLVASWLLDPSADPKTLIGLVNQFITEDSHLLRGLNKCNSYGSIACSKQNGYHTPGRIRACAEAVCCYRLMKKLKQDLKSANLWDVFSNLEMPHVKCLALMELNGIGFNEDACNKEVAILYEISRQLEEKAHRLARKQFNLGSPAEVAKVLFGDLGLPPGGQEEGGGSVGAVKAGMWRKGVKRGKKASWSTKKEVLEKLKDVHPLPAIILNWRQITFSLAKSMHPFLHISNLCKKSNIRRIHPECITHSATGRVSVAEPNIQNVPKSFMIQMADEAEKTKGKDYEVRIRDLFIPSNGHVFLAADYSQLELRIFAHLSGDEKLGKILNSEAGDVFKMIAAQWKGIRVQNVTSDERQSAKQICYGMLYGIGAKALSQQLNVEERNAEQFMESFLRSFPSVRTYIRTLVQECTRKGYVETLHGRRRYLPSINSCNMSERSQAERQAVNTTVQGSAADVVKSATIEMYKSMKKKWKIVISQSHSTDKPTTRTVRSSPGCYLVLHLHDELIFEVQEDILPEAAELIRSCMEKAVKLKVKLPVKISAGPAWGKLQEYS